MEFAKTIVDDIDAVEREIDEIDKVDTTAADTNLIKKPTVPEERGNKKKNKRIARQNSKEAALGVSGVRIYSYF